ncbi:MAG: CotH kinase family protein, partial [Myxococcota bacterium]|nr:CotH kinase family protein [Myxococcota bacterium]
RLGGALKRLTVNNVRQDGSKLNTCLSYSVFAAAGIPAPRCTYALVTLNGAALGPYVLVEEYKNPFMRRHFADITGNLYEGTACDWRPEFFGGFEQETNVFEDPSKADLQAVMDVMTFATDDLLEEALGEVFDLDRLYRFWAVESLVWHRDGYSGNANNYMLYADPALGGRFVFMPWGPDSALRPDNRANVPDSVLAFGAVTYRLYLTEGGRARFYQELTLLLDTVWDPEGLVATAEAVREMLTPHVAPSDLNTFTQDVDAVQTMIAERRAVIEEVLAPGYPDWTTGMRGLPCVVPVAPISGTFETTWGSLSQNIWDSGSGTLSLSLGGAPVTLTNSGARAGWKNAFAGRAQLHLDTDDNRRIKITFNLPDIRYFDDFLV